MNLKKLILAVCALLWLPLFGAPRVLWPQEASANVRWRLEGGAGTRDGCMKFENAKPEATPPRPSGSRPVRANSTPFAPR